MEGFLRNIETGRSDYSEEKIRLSEMAMEGKDPCKECPHKKDSFGDCNVMACLPYYRYFQFRWRRLRRRLSGK